MQQRLQMVEFGVAELEEVPLTFHPGTSFFTTSGHFYGEVYVFSVSAFVVNIL
jgi:hypothetical protein